MLQSQENANEEHSNDVFFWDAWLNIKHIFSPRPTTSIKVWIKSNTHLSSRYDPAFQTQKLKVWSGEY